MPPTLAVMMAGVCLFLWGCSRERSGSPTEELPGFSVVQESMTGAVSAEALKTMRWEDVVPTAEACARNRLSDSVLDHSVGLAEGPCIYLRGLLELSLSRPAQAHAEWSKLDPAAMPPDFLYAPWRLAATQAGGNRFAAPLAVAVKEGRTGALVSARWHAASANWEEALETYLKTDPANWSPHEVKQFRLMKLNSPTAREADQLMAGALRAGRVPKSLRADLARLIKERPKLDKAALAEALKSNPAFAAAATEAASRQLALRQAFASNRFAEVVEKIRDIDPSVASDETVLLAFLSAAKVGDRPLTDRWAQELRRRKPTAETAKWIAEIRKTKP
ncbi:MAG: hypothetical protein AB8D78_09250 [Akkermansiaceae bacterium]